MRDRGALARSGSAIIAGIIVWYLAMVGMIERLDDAHDRRADLDGGGADLPAAGGGRLGRDPPPGRRRRAPRTVDARGRLPGRRDGPRRRDPRERRVRAREHPRGRHRAPGVHLGDAGADGDPALPHGTGGGDGGPRGGDGARGPGRRGAAGIAGRDPPAGDRRRGRDHRLRPAGARDRAGPRPDEHLARPALLARHARADLGWRDRRLRAHGGLGPPAPRSQAPRRLAAGPRGPHEGGRPVASGRRRSGRWRSPGGRPARPAGARHEPAYRHDRRVAA